LKGSFYKEQDKTLYDGLQDISMEFDGHYKEKTIFYDDWMVLKALGKKE